MLCVKTARLTEAYYECKKNKFDSLVSSIGLSSATALSFKVMVILFVSIVLSKKSPTVNKKTGKFKTYGIEDRNEVTVESILLLLTHASDH